RAEDSALSRHDCNGAGILHRAQIIARVVLDRIDERVEFFNFAQRAQIISLLTGCIDAVSEEHNSLAAFDPIQPFSDRQIDSVIQARRTSSVGIYLYYAFDQGQIVCRFSEQEHLIVEANYQDAVLWSQLFGELNRRFSDL